LGKKDANSLFLLSMNDSAYENITADVRFIPVLPKPNCVPKSALPSFDQKNIRLSEFKKVHSFSLRMQYPML